MSFDFNHPFNSLASLAGYGSDSTNSQGPNSRSDPGAMTSSQMTASPMNGFSSQSLLDGYTNGNTPNGSWGGAAAAGGMGGSGNQFNTSLGLNYGTGQLAIGGIGALGNLWNAYQANQLANKTYNFQSGMANTNLANQIQS